MSGLSPILQSSHLNDRSTSWIQPVGATDWQNRYRDPCIPCDRNSTGAYGNGTVARVESMLWAAK